MRGQVRLFIARFRNQFSKKEPLPNFRDKFLVEAIDFLRGGVILLLLPEIQTRGLRSAESRLFAVIGGDLRPAEFVKLYANNEVNNEEDFSTVEDQEEEENRVQSQDGDQRRTRSFEQTPQKRAQKSDSPVSRILCLRHANAKPESLSR